MFHRFLPFTIYFLLLPGCESNNTTPAPTERDIVLLKNVLDTIHTADQKYRVPLFNNENSDNQKDSLWACQYTLDSINMLKIESIIQRFGYPGAKLVGEQRKSTAALVIIHNPKQQKKYLDLIWEAAKNNDIEKREAAILQDRILMFEGKKQIYGTQMYVDSTELADKNSPKKFRVWAIENPSIVDDLRYSVGLYPLLEQCILSDVDIKEVEGYIYKKNSLSVDGILIHTEEKR